MWFSLGNCSTIKIITVLQRKTELANSGQCGKFMEFRQFPTYCLLQDKQLEEQVGGRAKTGINTLNPGKLQWVLAVLRGRQGLRMALAHPVHLCNKSSYNDSQCVHRNRNTSVIINKIK